MSSIFSTSVLQRFAWYPPQSTPKISFSTYGYVPRSWLHNDENPISIVVFVLELFNLQYTTFYFEMDSSNSLVCLKTEFLVRDWNRGGTLLLLY